MLCITIKEFEDFGHHCVKTDDVDESGSTILKCSCGITGSSYIKTCIKIPHGQDSKKIFKCPNHKIKPGLYIIVWMNLTSSMASVGYDQAGNAWYAPTNWSVVPGYDWSAILSLQPVLTKLK